jgi:flagellar basal-body rod modification protein FlgD
MQTSVIDPVASAAQAAAGREPVGPQELGRDEFLRLLVAKLENQDPLKPASDTEFISQLATFSSLEQLIDVNDQLEGLTLSQTQLVNAQALGLIGRDALLAGDGTLRISGGHADTILYEIPRQAREASLSVIDSNGKVVRTFELEKLPSGRVLLEWDGTDENGEPLPDGEYRIEATATDYADAPMPVVLYRSLRIDGVGFLEGVMSLMSDGREIPFDSIIEILAGRS